MLKFQILLIKVNFSIFQKNLITYVTPWFSSTVSPKGFKNHVLVLLISDISDFTITYVMSFFERLKWNSVFKCSEDLHV